MEKFRTRKFKILAYPESSPQIVDRLRELDWNFIGILHDKDKNKDGSLKKPHYHFMIVFQNACFNTSIARQLKLDERFVRRMETTNEKQFLAYLTHFGSKDKYQYSDNDLIYNNLGLLKQYENACTSLGVEVLTESEKALEIVGIIEGHENLNFIGLLKLCCERGLYDVLRRNSTMFIHILKESKIKLDNIKEKDVY